MVVLVAFIVDVGKMAAVSGEFVDSLGSSAAEEAGTAVVVDFVLAVEGRALEASVELVVVVEKDLAEVLD